MKDNNKKILGFAFLFQFITSFISGVVQKSYIYNRIEIKELLHHLSKHRPLFLMTLFMDMLTALGVIFLGVILYINLKPINNKIALTGLSFYILEGVVHVFSKLESFKLFNLSLLEINQLSDQVYIHAELLIRSTEFSTTVMMLAFCTGAILFYYLLTKSNFVPMVLSLWGLITVSLLLIWTVLAFFNISVPFLLYLPYVPFELVIGIWLLSAHKVNKK